VSFISTQNARILGMSFARELSKQCAFSLLGDGIYHLAQKIFTLKTRNNRDIPAYTLDVQALLHRWHIRVEGVNPIIITKDKVALILSRIVSLVAVNMLLNKYFKVGSFVSGSLGATIGLSALTIAVSKLYDNVIRSRLPRCPLVNVRTNRYYTNLSAHLFDFRFFIISWTVFGVGSRDSASATLASMVIPALLKTQVI
jgi:hypothetical protein